MLAGKIERSKQAQNRFLSCIYQKKVVSLQPKLEYYSLLLLNWQYLQDGIVFVLY